MVANIVCRRKFLPTLASAQLVTNGFVAQVTATRRRDRREPRNGQPAQAIASSNPTQATLPATVVVPAGATQVTTIQAAFGGVTQTANLTVTP